MGQCLRGKLADVGLVPAAPAAAVAETPDAPPAAPEQVAIVEEAVSPEPQLDVTPPVETATLTDDVIAATFGLLRAEPDGSVVIAGSGTPGSEVEIYANGELIGSVKVEPSGDWVFVPDAPLPPGGLEITLGEVGKTGSADESFIVAINEDKTSQPLVVASTPGQASDILQGLVGPATPGTQVAQAPEPAAAPIPASEPAVEPALEVATLPQPAAPVAAPAAGPSPAESPAPAAQPAAPEPVPAQPAATQADPAPQAAPAAAIEVPAPAVPEVAAPSPTPEVPAIAAPASEPSSPLAAPAEGAGPGPAVAPASTPEPAAAPEPTATPLPLPTTAPQPVPAPAPPAIQLASVPPSIDAIEIENQRTFFAGGGPDGFIIRLYVDDTHVADATVEEGRWLIEAGPVLDKPTQRVRVDLLRPGTAEVTARAEVDFVVDVPAAEPAIVVADAAEEVATPQPAAVAAPTEAAPAPSQPAPTENPAPPQPVAPAPTPAQPQATAPAVPQERPPSTPPAQPASSEPAAAAPVDAPTEAPPAVEPAPAVPTMVAVALGDPEAQRFASGKAIIRRGDNLWTIARRVYGDGLKYTTIYEANTGYIRDPNRIYPGQVFDLPQGR